MKTCSKCGVEQPLKNFNKSPSGKDGLTARCKGCLSIYGKKHYQNNKLWYKYKNSEWQKENKQKVKQDNEANRLRKTYNLSVEDFENLKIKQNNQCDICKTNFTDRTSTAIDHCHITGKVRGLLCKKCNSGLGMFNDNFETVSEAAKYLEKNRG